MTIRVLTSIKDTKRLWGASYLGLLANRSHVIGRVPVHMKWEGALP